MVPGTFLKLYIHITFGTDFRKKTISPKWEERLHKYMTGTLQNLGNKMIRINGTDDHVHILFGLKSNQKISDIVKELKVNSAKFINDNQLSIVHFKWQKGYCAVSVSESVLSTCIKYIDNQKEHHKKTNFRDEVKGILKQHGIDFDERFLP